MRQQLSDHEVRMALNDGKFSVLLSSLVNEKIDLLGEVISNPRHPRNTELILRFLSFRVVPQIYAGRLKNFLDESVKLLNDQWSTYEPELLKAVDHFDSTLAWLIQTFPSGKVGRRFHDGTWEGRLNAFLLECQIVCLSALEIANIQKLNKQTFLQDFTKTCDSEPFLSAITGYMDGTRKYNIRFQCMSDLIEKQVPMIHRPIVGTVSFDRESKKLMVGAAASSFDDLESHEIHANG